MSYEIMNQKLFVYICKICKKKRQSVKELIAQREICNKCFRFGPLAGQTSLL